MAMSWGAEVTSGNSAGRIGISITSEDKGSYENVTATAWFWSKYSVKDSNNNGTLKVVANDKTTILNTGAVNINHTSDHGGWDVTNQTKLFQNTVRLDKQTTSYTARFEAVFGGIDTLNSQVMYASINHVVMPQPTSNNRTTIDIGTVVNGTIDDDGGQLTFDLYLNGSLIGDDIKDRWIAVDKGTTYSITDIKPYSGYRYNGVHSGALSGTINDTTKVYLSVSKLYTISYSANGGTGAPSSQIKAYGENLILSNQIPTKSGYIFQGWGTSPGGIVKYAPGSTFTGNSNTVLYAIWESNLTSIDIGTVVNGDVDENGGQLTFDLYLNGSLTYGDSVHDDIQDRWIVVPKGTTYSITDIKALSGYQYNGVYSGSLSGTLNDTNKVTKVYLSVSTIYTVSYNANGGTNAPSKQTKVYGENLTLSNQIPTRAGYIFQGWGTSSSASTASYQPGSEYIENSNLILYAIWKARPAQNIYIYDNGKIYARGFFTNSSLSSVSFDKDGNIYASTYTIDNNFGISKGTIYATDFIEGLPE